jgi:hypothetical protein
VSCCIQLSIQHLFRDCCVLHSFYVSKPSYSLAFNKPDNILLAWTAHTDLNLSALNKNKAHTRFLISITVVTPWTAATLLSYCFQCQNAV